jgi:hypothetical protein
VRGDDLTSIPGLQANHQRALASKLGITSLRSLAAADQRAIHTALQNIRPRPSLARIAAWQDNARTRVNDTAGGGSAWRAAASFAVIFTQRQVDGTWERRLEAEQTEVEPAPEPKQWSDWDCGPLCDWMLAQVGRPETSSDSGAGGVSRTATAEKPAARDAAPRQARAELRIDSVSITDALQELDLITGGRLIPARPRELRLPVRLRLTVSGGRSGQQLTAAVWFRRPAGPGWTPQDPVNLPRSGRAEFDLSLVPPGGHDIRLLAWAAGSGATMAAVTLPRLTFRPSADHEGDLRPHPLANDAAAAS